jgi:2-polyprenyl-6-methoxyphenol hydroxylase-like FAD-dependent oxidoreductase
VLLRHQLLELMRRDLERRGATVQFGHRLESAEREPEGIRLRFADGREELFDVVIGCDGVHSRVRECLGLSLDRGGTGLAYLLGVSSWKFDLHQAREIWGPGRRFGICPLADGQVYFFCSVPPRGWEAMSGQRLQDWIAEWAPFGPEVLEVLRGVADWDRVTYSELPEPVDERWCDPPVFLVGDAPHPSSPNLGQGANSAMVDALVLTQILARTFESGGSLDAAGEEYEALRRPFVGRLQLLARQMGEVACGSSAPARIVRHLLVPIAGGLGLLRRRMMLLGAGYNPDEEEYFELRGVAGTQRETEQRRGLRAQSGAE